MIGPNSVYGLCLVSRSDWKSEEEKQESLSRRISTTRAVRVECSVTSCRAQYVVHNKEKLNVKPKCITVELMDRSVACTLVLLSVQSLGNLSSAEVA